MPEQDTEALFLVCCIGGCKFSVLSKSTQYLPSEFVSELKTCFDVDVDKDIEGCIHPTCFLCPKVVSRCS